MFLREHDVFHKKQTDEEGKRMLDLLFFVALFLFCFVFLVEISKRPYIVAPEISNNVQLCCINLTPSLLACPLTFTHLCAIKSIFNVVFFFTTGIPNCLSYSIYSPCTCVELASYRNAPLYMYR